MGLQGEADQLPSPGLAGRFEHPQSLAGAAGIGQEPLQVPERLQSGRAARLHEPPVCYWLMSPRRLSQPELARRIEACRVDYEAAKAALGDIGFTCEGSLVTRWRSCANPNCRCVDPDHRHGPYRQLSWKQGGRTVSRLLSAEDAELYRSWIDNRRRLEAALEAMRDISHRAGAYILQQHGGTLQGPDRPRRRR